MATNKIEALQLNGHGVPLGSSVKEKLWQIFPFGSMESADYIESYQDALKELQILINLSLHEQGIIAVIHEAYARFVREQLKLVAISNGNLPENRTILFKRNANLLRSILNQESCSKTSLDPNRIWSQLTINGVLDWLRSGEKYEHNDDQLSFYDKLKGNLMCSLLTIMLPKSLKDEKSQKSFESLLEMVVQEHCRPNNESEEQCQSVECLLEIVCQLKTSLRFPEHLKILGENNFLWKLIAKGLSHEDGLTRKRANYLLKRAIDMPHTSHVDECDKTLLVSYMDSSSFKEQRKIWDDFFLVIETLEEKQVHLVKQVFNKIQRLVEKVPNSLELSSKKKSFHIAWIMVIYKLLFQHQNNAIVKWSVHNFLTTFDYKYIGYSEFIDFLCGPLLSVLNSSKHFSYKEPNISCETEDLLTNFLAEFTHKNRLNSSPSHAFWNSFLQAVFTLSWGPLPLYHVTRAISNVLKEIGPNRTSVLSKDTSCQIIQFASRDMYCQEPLLRCASRCHMLEVLTHSTNLSNLAQDNEDIMGAFKRLMNFVGKKEILIWNTQLWQKVVAWVEPHLLYENYESLLGLMISKLQANITPEIKHQMANLIGFVSMLWCSTNKGVKNGSVITVIDELWGRILSIVNRPYSQVGYHIYLYSLATVIRLMNPPQKRRGKEHLFRFCELVSENQLCCSDFMAENLSEICNVMQNYFQTVDVENIQFIDDGILVFQQTLKMVTTYDRVLGSIRECRLKLVKTIIGMLASFTNEYERSYLQHDVNFPDMMKKVSYMKLLGHDWWSGSCRCYRFSNFDTGRNMANLIVTNVEECSNCRSAGPLEFVSMKNVMCSFHWLNNSSSGTFPSLQLIKSRPRGTEVVNREHQFWGALQSQFIACQWKCLRNWLIMNSFDNSENGRVDSKGISVKNPNELSFEPTCLVNKGISALCTGGLDSLVPVQNCISYFTNCYYQSQKGSSELCNKVKTPDVLKLVVKKFIPQAKSAVLDVRKNEEFWPALEAFVEMSLGLCILQYEDFIDDSLDLVRSLFDLSETVGGISCLVIKHIANISRNDRIDRRFVQEILAMASLSGSIHKKDQIQYMKANQLIHNQGGYKMPASLIEGTDHLIQSDIKAYTIQILNNAKKNYKSQIGSPYDLVISIKEQASTLIGNRDKHYFENSYTHLVLLRMHQMLLCMTELELGEDDVELLSRIALERITIELGHQLSVRYLCEWMLVILATKTNFGFETLVSNLVHEYFNAAKLSRPNCMPSYIAIASHIAMISAKSLNRDKEKSEKLIADAMKIIAPWCMAPQFTTRLYAQIFFKRLYFVASERPFSKVSNDFFILNNCISESLILGDKEKNADKIMSDFYLTRFDPRLNFNLENIFYDFPRLMNVLSQEWAAKEVFRSKISQGDEFSIIPICNQSNSLNIHKVELESWALGTVSKEDWKPSWCTCVKCFNMLRQEKEDYPCNAIFDKIDSSNLQKKIMPWTAMFSDDDQLLELESNEPSIKACQDLVVVASLIDKIPNLGGLCRSCEIFGVGTYAIGSVKYCDNKEFQTLSVTADKWQKIIEVKRGNDLLVYLRQKQSEGFVIVGIEQTARSVVLDEYKFNPKTVLVLGNEKEGIPIEIIDILDVCVEIPQSGRIRSFNVHVTGALVLWEYVRQARKLKQIPI